MQADVTILKNGNLQISVDEETRQEIEEQAEYRDEDTIMMDLMESHAVNGSYAYFSASHGNPAVGLTDAPCIAESLVLNEEGDTYEVNGGLWFFDEYALCLLTDELAEKGHAIFTKA